jgi:hypothetical protein
MPRHIPVCGCEGSGSVDDREFVENLSTSSKEELFFMALVKPCFDFHYI